MEIVGANSYPNGVYVDPLSGDYFNTSFFWNGGTQTIYPTGGGYGTAINRFLGPSRYFGWQVTCRAPGGQTCGDPNSILAVRGIQLVAIDTTAPGILPTGPNNVFGDSGRWIRGAGWSASFIAADDSGVCDMGVAINGSVIAGPSDTAPNRHSWTQCTGAVTDSLPVDTANYPNGSMGLVAYADDAASPANHGTLSSTMNVDNQPVDLSLSGPTSALSTSGTQYITATASAGPSGVGIDCSLDGAPYQWYQGASEQIPVNGLGTHQLNCFAQNGALDVSGNPARSTSQSWTLSIRQPAVLAIAFRRVVNALRCTRVSERVRVPAHWITIHRHHHTMHVHKRASYKRVKVTRCHPRTIWRRVAVWKVVKRHHHKVLVKRYRWERQVLLPRVVAQTVKRVAFGHGTIVSGWLGLPTGVALAGTPVEILTAPDNGQGAFKPAAWTTTAADGSWRAALAPGPSRLVSALYPGSSITAPALGAQLRLIVPAKITIAIQPRIVPWGGHIRITGRVLGGYIPAGSNILRLLFGDGPHPHTIGVPRISPDGRFSISVKWSAGQGVVHYWFAVATLAEGDYPYAPNVSKRVGVTVGLPTP